MKKNNKVTTRTVVGTHSVAEVFKVRPDKVEEVWIKKGSSGDPQIMQVLKNIHKKAIKEKAEGELNKLSHSHQGIAVFVTESPEWDLEKLKNSDPDAKKIILVLDGLVDPHNLGAMMRTAWLMGVEAILVPERRAAHMTPTVSKVACGGAEHVPVVVENIPQILSDLKELGFWVYGLSGEGSQPIWNCKLPEKVVWIIGSEGKGMRSTVANCCDELVKIPQQSQRASYNASVACGMALSETLRQHQSL